MRIGKIAGTWFPLIVLAAGALAVFLPTPFLPLGSLITPLLMIIMLGMGMTLQASDFAMVVKRPYALIIGMLAQYLIMPATAWLVVTILDLTPAIAVGVILVSAAPGGTASNVMTYLAKGDIALSVSMTTVSTLVAPIVTPMLVLWLAGSYLPVDAGALFLSIIQIVLVPIVVGVLMSRFLPRVVARLTPWMPLVSVTGITLVVLAVVAGSAPGGEHRGRHAELRPGCRSGSGPLLARGGPPGRDLLRLAQHLRLGARELLVAHPPRSLGPHGADLREVRTAYAVVLCLSRMVPLPAR